MADSVVTDTPNTAGSSTTLDSLEDAEGLMDGLGSLDLRGGPPAVEKRLGDHEGVTDAGLPDLQNKSPIMVPPKPKPFGPEATRPLDDDRSADELIEQQPTLEMIRDSDDRDLKWLRDKLDKMEGLENWETDPDAACRAAGLINRIELFDSDGKPKEDGFADGKLNGWVMAQRWGGILTDALDMRPERGTEGSRLRDFLENGWDAFGEEVEIQNFLKDGQRIHTF